MRRLLFFFFVFAVPTFAQRTIVSGTVTDPNGLPYSQASVTITLSLPTGALGAYLNGAQIAGTVNGGKTDNNGAFLVQLADNTLIQCANAQGQIVACVPQTQWSFSFNESPGVAPPVGTGPQTCLTTLTISGTSQTVSPSGCPALIRVGNSIGAASNVKNAPFNAIGNGKFFVDGVSNAGNNQLTSAQAVFAATDVNQNVSCVSAPLLGGATLRINSTVTAFVSSSTIVYGGANAGVFTGMFCALTNPADPAAILAAFNAAKSTFNGSASGNSTQNEAGNIYLPAGVYGLSTTLDNLITTGAEGCVGILGDGDSKTIIIPTGSFVGVGHGGVGGFIINGRCTGNLYKDFSVEMSSIPTPNGFGGIISVFGSNSFVENVSVYDQCSIGAGNLFGLYSLGGTNEMWIHPTVVSAASCPSAAGGLGLTSVSQATVLNAFLSNTNLNVLVQNATSGANGAGIVFSGGIVDEGGIPSVQNSVDVWFQGLGLTGGANCLSVDATSFMWMTGGYCGTFGGGTGGGPTVASGGVLNMTQVHVNAVNAGSACYTSAAYGGIVDDGTNRCTTSGGGTVYPSGGFLNRTSLSHAQMNAFQSGTLATTTNLQGYAVDQPIAIQTLSWTPGNAFACTAGSFPTFSITDGTTTLTSSASDTSTNGTVTHTFPNTTASILNATGAAGTQLRFAVVTTGTCGTPPTNTNINVWWQATAPGL